MSEVYTEGTNEGKDVAAMMTDKYGDSIFVSVGDWVMLKDGRCGIVRVLEFSETLDEWVLTLDKTWGTMVQARGCQISSHEKGGSE